MVEVTSTNPLLESLQDLAQITSNYGLIKVKPFKDWNDLKWKERIFTFRLCNVGEILDIAERNSDVPEIARDQSAKIEVLVRSIWEIDGRPLITPEELKKYNDVHKSKLSDKDYLRLWIRNIEQIVLERLYSVYENLQAKQLRQLQNMYLCVHCLRVFNESEVPNGSFKLAYSVADILCTECSPDIKENTYDFEMVEGETSSDKEPVKEEDKAEAQEEGVNEEAKDDTKSMGASINFTPYICDCGERCSTLEEFVKHRETCEKSQ